MVSKWKAVVSADGESGRREGREERRGGGAFVAGLAGVLLVDGGLDVVGEERGKGEEGGHSRHGDMEGAPGDVLVSPFDHQGVAAFLLQQVDHAVEFGPQVFDQDFLARHLGAMHSDQ